MKIDYLLKNFLIAFIVLPVMALGQINVSEKVQVSKSANNSENALYFIDFWATWCGPCVYAKEYLGVLQKQYPNDFYVVSISQENPELVRKYLKKRPTDLAVFVDYEGETFNKHNIRLLPHGILMNADGDVLWEGSPTDFKASDLARFLRSNTKKKHVDKFFKDKGAKTENIETVYQPKSAFEIKTLKKESFDFLQIQERSNYVEFKGSVKDILAYNLKVYKSQVKLSDDLDQQYHMCISKSNNPYGNHTAEIIDALKLEMYHSEVKGEAMVFDIESITFWDTNQIDWGRDTAKYLIDEYQIQADNVTFKEVLYQLSQVLEKPVVTVQDITDTAEHDWSIHYKFYDLMQSDLLDNYGIKAEAKTTSYKLYTLTKKAP
ncbi:TlpA family protein disulfide reductase [Meridianimaribacter flavus]|uniref:Thiol-disulfide isomerase/thioredoxin n=1 Tax=Meridianimaribacter flavus TaxID=571115 RepID=A0ABY2G2K7_9FLAO|nr:TlpA family protein disulfide reductase [Meridianimaribacter flavus]TDY07620.1 thiol-disulfide isomerase/thioredoxin [Meridianimaribacter flavus]